MSNDHGSVAQPAAKSGVIGKISNLLLALLPILCLVYILDFHTQFGITFYAEQYLSLFLAIFMAASFLTKRAHPKIKGKAPWYDIVLAVTAFIIFGRVAIYYEDMMVLVGFSPWSVAIWGLIAILLILEIVRRTMGWTLVIIAVVFLCYGHFSYLVPGFLNARGVSWNRLFTFIYLDNNSILGIPIGVAGTMVLGFLFFGSCLSFMGGGDFLADLALALMGRQRGGAAKVAVIASGMFGSLSGSPSANCAVTGTVTIPLMIRTGFRPHMAGAIEAASATGGIIMPPVMGITAFMMSEFLGIPYYQVALGAAIPAILFYFAILLQVHFEAVGTGIQGLRPDEVPRLKAVMKKGWIFFLPIAALFYMLFIRNMDPGAAAMYSAIIILIVGLIRPENRRNFFSKVWACLTDSGRQTLIVAVACASAGLVIGSVYITNMGMSLSKALIEVSGGHSFVLLILAALSSIVLGMGMPVAATYIMLAILVVPALTESGMNPFASHLFLNYFAAMSFITPPVCIAAFVAAGIAKCNFMKCGYSAMRMSVAAYLVPFAFCYSTGMLLWFNSIGDILISSIAAFIGIFFIAAGLSSQLYARMSLTVKVLSIAGGCLMLFPFLSAIVAGLIINLGVLFWQRRLRTNASPAAA